MNPVVRHPLLPILILLGLSAVTHADEPKTPRQAPHVHGIAHLTLAVEGPEVLVELTSPAASLIGFERAPRTDAERETLALAKANLEAGDAMIRFSTLAACRLETAEIEVDLPEIGQDHDHGHDHGHEDANHADVHVSYRFTCDRPDALSSAALGLFAGFPALERVLVQYVIPEGQGGAELTPRQAVVNFVPF